MSDAAGGVYFDIFANGRKVKVSWTRPGSGNAWLALDRNGNGVIDGAQELFGNHTPQPASSQPNGFLALAVFDDPQHGGNGDGWISADDKIFPQLRIWQDKNHNGISEPAELRSLASAGIRAISLQYTLSQRVDEFGNRFRYRAAVRDDRGSEVSKVAWDVFPRLK